ncbi:MAG: nucleotidyltransferase domain-containing protein [Thaumarchaeota archaeon]|jgi:predicted nucleotidyltransferase|nr:nucleotidyltransferase domain-containing protein [Nitrososphaerota archaeon]
MHLENLDKIRDSEYRELVEQYIEKISKLFKEKIVGILLFGSVAKGKAKPFSSAESDIDLILVVEGLPKLQERILMASKLIAELKLPSIVQAIYMTPEEFETHTKSKSGWIIDALIDGIILHDPKSFLQNSKEKLLRELMEKGVERTSYGWAWPIRAGEKTC